MPDLRLTILVTFYNFEPYVQDCLASILKQKTRHAYKIICIDDHSEDNTWGYLNAFQQKFPDKIEIYRTEKNQGSGRSAIFSIRPEVKTDYLTYLDGDDFWHSDDKLEKQINFLDEHQDYVGTTHRSLVLKDQIQESNICGQFPVNAWTIKELLEHEAAFYCHTIAYMWRNIYLQEDGFCLPEEMEHWTLRGDKNLTAYYMRGGEPVWGFQDLYSVYRVTGQGSWTQADYATQQKWLLGNYVTKNAITDGQFRDYLEANAQKIIDKLKAAGVTDYPQPNFDLKIEDLTVDADLFR